MILEVVLTFTLGLYFCSQWCTNKYCRSADDIGKINLLNYLKAEADSIFLVFYKQGLGFTIVADSLMVYICGSSDSTKFYGCISRNISIDFDYKPYFTAIKKVNYQ